MARPGTSRYWRECREAIWVMHGAGLTASEIAEKGPYPIGSVRVALRELDSKVRLRRLAVEEAERAARRAEVERDRIAREAALATAAARKELERAARKAALDQKRREKLSRPRLTVEDRIAAHWAKGEDTFEIGRIVRKSEHFVVKVLVAHREAARRRALRGAA